MKNKVFFLPAVLLGIFVFAIGITYFTKDANAGFLSGISDTLSRIQQGVGANHTIEFVTPTGVHSASQTIVLGFNTASPNFGLTFVQFTDMDLLVYGTSVCTGSPTSKTLSIGPGVATWGVSVDFMAGTITFTAPTDATTGEIPAGRCVRVLIGNHANGGEYQIINPASAGTYDIGITGTFGDTGNAAVAIVSDDQIDISASVDPTLDVVISSNTCALGVLSSTYIQTCEYDVTVSTNALSGYLSTIVADGQLRNTVNSITNAAGGTVVKGAEEYGVGTSKAGQTIVQNTACTDNDTGASQPASALTTSAQQFASASGPISSDVTTMCHLASVSGATPAGSYAQVATIVVTANY